MRKVVIILVIPILFFIISFVTLKDYGVSWDEPEHFLRGQGYLHFFLTGEKRFSENNPRPSYYQDNSLSAQHFFKNDNGHPPLNDILAATSNYIFFQNLRVLSDIDAYHLFNILCATLLVLVVSVFAYKTIGVKGAIVAASITAFYPLLFSEGHFNIKDPPQAAFYTLGIFAFWMSLKKGNWKWLVLSAVAAGFSFGMKFNILFLPLIILSYLIIRYWKNLKIKYIRKIPRKYLVALIASPIIVVSIFFITWPFLWSDPIENFIRIFTYYKEIGTDFHYQRGYYLMKFNLYPILWIITSTPPMVLILSAIGILTTLKDKTKEKTYLLWLLWFVFPILRVSVPGSSIYGGVRQIMEYIPALGLISGLGFVKISEKFKSAKVTILAFVIIFIAILMPIIKYHPYQNTYFNFLIGGLKGAMEKKIPYSGNSYGNAYLEIIRWMNQNSPQDSHVALVQGTALNIPAITLRPDITRWNNFWSGIDRKGEYLTELTYTGVKVAYPYAWEYVENFLEPVYEVKVDGVAIAKLWKNDLEHTRAEMRNKKEVKYVNPAVSIVDGKITAEMREDKILNKIIVNYKDDPNCVIRGSVQISLDLKSWHTEPEPIPTEQISEKKMVDKGKMTYYFAGKKVKGIRVIPDLPTSCLLSKPIVEIYILE